MPSKKHSLVAALAAAASLSVLAVALFGTSVASAAPATSTMKKCLHPKTSVVKVTEFEYGFKITPKIPHCGTVTFKQRNTGALSHNFDLQGVKAGKLIAPHASTSFKVKLGPGKFNYLCDVLGHASLGMTGTLKVID